MFSPLSLRTGETGVSHGASDDEVSAGVDVVLGLGVEVLAGDDGLDDLLHDVLAEGLEGDLLAVLGRHDDGVDAEGHARAVLELVLASHLNREETLKWG